MKYVNSPIVKVDAVQLTGGKPVYTDDMAPKDCLILKLLRSPHAHAKIVEFDKSIALKVPGVVGIYSHGCIPLNRYTSAGQSYPEPSPYDRLILDDTMRYVGDVVAIVAAESEKAANTALRLIKVKYELLPAVLDFEHAIDNPSILHNYDDYFVNIPIGNQHRRNICSSGETSIGDVDSELNECDAVVDQYYYVQAQAQAMMETFRTFTQLDTYGRLVVTSSTQVPFHVRRILARALGMSKAKIRVIKPRIGGGFGAKQTICSEVYPALVTFLTGRPAKIVYTRQETFSASSSRHQMRVRIRLGADKCGKLRAVEVNTLSNTGAYGEHGCTTVGLTGSKTMPLYSHVNATRFKFDVVYTNTMPAGALRGYGATQGIFAMESAMDELAAKLKIDPITLREMNIVHEGDTLKNYDHVFLSSSKLDKCIQTGRKLINWDEKYPRKWLDDTRVRAVGMAITMQGSGIANLDTASIEIKLGDQGYYTLMTASTDMGTGSDTILCQMAADCLDTSMDKIIVHGVDTDVSPYDTGSYASSTTYVTGMAVVKAATLMRSKICAYGADLLDLKEDQVEFDGEKVYSIDDPNLRVTLDAIGQRSVLGQGSALSAHVSHGSKTSPPPFMAGFAEIELDTATGKVTPINYVGVVDCGTVINPALATIQAEGGIVQGIGMALYEVVRYDERGRMATDSFMQYKLPTRLDVGNIIVGFEPSYEPSGPFGAKSIGEIVINTPSPAIANALRNACGINMRKLPMTPEKIYMELQRVNESEPRIP